MSTTKNLGLFKHDNPATNTDEFNVDKALNQNWDKLDTAIGTDRERITTLETDNTTNKQDITNIKAKDTEQDKYIAELEAEKARLREDLNGLPKGQASGESIDLTDSAEMRCELKISGNSKQETRKGYNLFNPNKALTTSTRTLGGATVTKNSDGSFTVSGSGTLTSDFGGGYVDYTHEETMALLKEGKITFDCGVKTMPICLVEILNSSGRYIPLNNWGCTSSSSTITAEMIANETLKIRVGFYAPKGETIISGTIKPMLYQEGNGTFELFGKSPSSDYPSDNESCGDNGSINEVVCNKNICNFGNLQNSHIGLTNNLNKNVWKISGTATSNDYVISTMRINLGKFKAGKYCFSWKYSGNLSLISSGGVFISLFSKNNETSTTIQNKSINTENKFTSFTLNEEAEISLGIWNTGNGNIYDIEIECQLELSETNTEIVEHKKQVYTIPTQKPFRAVGNTRDTFIKKNNKWYERHYVSRKIFDGTEDWKLSQDSDFYTKKYNDIIKASSKVICNYFPNIVGFTGQNTVFIGDTSAIGITNTNYTNVSDFTAWLLERYNAGKPVYIDCLLKTPLDIECTEEQSTILWDIEQNAKTYDKVTHMYSTDKISSYKDVTYKKDIDTMITTIEQAILSQGGNI